MFVGSGSQQNCCCVCAFAEGKKGERHIGGGGISSKQQKNRGVWMLFPLAPALAADAVTGALFHVPTWKQPEISNPVSLSLPQLQFQQLLKRGGKIQELKHFKRHAQNWT